MNLAFSDDLKTAENIANGTGYGTSVEKIGLTLWVHILALPFISHVVLGKLFNLSVSQCPHLL